MARINTKVALSLFLLTAAIGGGGYGLYWWSNRLSPARLEAKGDKAAAAADALAKEGHYIDADKAYIEACNQYGRVLQQNASEESALNKFINLTLHLSSPTTQDATSWAIQHLLTCRHKAQISEAPGALREFYDHAMHMSLECQSIALANFLRTSADNDAIAHPKQTESRVYRGVGCYLMVTLPATTEGLTPTQKQSFFASAKTDLETAHQENPQDCVCAIYLALLRVREIQLLQGREDASAALLAKDALKILDDAQAAHPDDLSLAVAYAHVAQATSHVTKISAEPKVRNALALAQKNPSALSVTDLGLLAEVLCKALTKPLKKAPSHTHALWALNSQVVTHTEGQQAALSLAEEAVAKHPSTLELATLAFTQSFGGEHGQVETTIAKALAAPSRLSVAERLIFEACKPALLFQLARAQINEAIAQTDAQKREDLRLAAKKTTQDLRDLNNPLMAGQIMQLEAQEYFLNNRFEEAASRFDLAMHQHPELVTPSILRAHAICHVRSGNLGAAVKLLEDLLMLDSGNAEAEVLLISSMFKMGYPENEIAPHVEAIKSYEQSKEFAGDLALRSERFWDAAQAYASLDSYGALAKRAQALRAMGKDAQARTEVLSFLRTNPISLQTTFLACKALDAKDQDLVLSAAEKAGLPQAHIKTLRHVLSNPEEASATDLDTRAKQLGMPLPSGAQELLTFWRKHDFKNFELGIAKASPEVLDYPDVLEHRFEFCMLRRDWTQARKMLAHAQDLHLDLSLGSMPALLASVTAMQSLETGSPTADEATRLLQDAAEKSPASAGIWTLLANVLLADDKPTLALQAAEQACRLQPHRADRLQLLFQCKLRSGQVYACLDFLKKMTDSLPYNDDLRELWLTSEEAVGDIDKVTAARIARNKSTPEDLFNALRLAGVYTRQGNTQEALTLLQHVAPRCTDHPQAALPLAAALCRAGFADEARATLRSLLGSFKPAQVSFWLASLEGNIGDPASSAAAWQTALDLEPSQTRPTSQAYAAHLGDMGRYNDMVTYLRALLKVIPQASPVRDGVLTSLSDALCALNQFDEAEELTAQMSEVPAALLHTHIALLRRQDTDALRFAKQAATLAPSNPDIWVNLGTALSSDPLRQPEAREAVDKALALAPTHAGARHLEAMLDAQMGHYRLASNRLWRNLAINPGYAPSFRLLTELSLQEKESNSLQGLSVAGLQNKPDDLSYLRAATRSALAQYRDAKIMGYRTEEQTQMDWATGFQTQALRQTDSPLDAISLLAILIETNRADAALTVISRLTPQVRQLPPLLILHAGVLLKLGQSTESRDIFAKAFNACHSADEVSECIRLSTLVMLPQAALNMARETLGDKRQDFARLGIGVSAMSLELPKETLAELTPLILQTTPDTDKKFAARLVGTLGNAEDMLGQEESAAAHYRLAIEKNPEDLVSLNNLANLLLRSPALALQEGEPLTLARQASFIASRSAALGEVPRHDLAAIRDTLGLALQKRDRIKEAYSVYESAIAICPIPEVYLHLGQLREAEHASAEALPLFQKAVTLADARGQSRLAAQARWHLNPQSFKANVNYALELAKINPQWALPRAQDCVRLAQKESPPAEELALFMRLATQVWSAPKTEEPFAEGLHIASTMLKQAASNRPNDARVHLLLALNQNQINDEDWEKTLNQAFTLEANGELRWMPPQPSTFPLPPIAKHAAAQWMPDTPWALAHESLASLKTLLALAPTNDALTQVFNVLDLQCAGKHAQALELLKDMPETSLTQKRLAATSLALTKQTQQAVDDLTYAVAHPDNSITDHVRLMGLLMQLGKPESDFLPLADAVLKRDPACPTVRELLGDLALAKKDYATASALYDGLSAKDVPAASVNHATALREMGKAQAALNVLENAINQCPSDPWILEAYLQSEPLSASRQMVFIKSCSAGLNAQLVVAFANRWDLNLRPDFAPTSTPPNAAIDERKSAKEKIVTP